MKNLFMILLLLNVGTTAFGQIFFVDQIKGKSAASGGRKDPLASLKEAVKKANALPKDKSVTIKLAPGLYTLSAPLIVGGAGQPASGRFSLEAWIMPDDTAWRPSSMPVIEVTADSNRTGKLLHAAVAISVERDNVAIRGLKFIGNPNPLNEYYYPIERRSEKLKNLEIAQCYFIGEKNAASIQGAVFAQGEGIHIDHSIFYNCKNAILAFLNVKDFALTHSIVYGAYEAAIWFGYDKYADLPFRFENNIIANGNYVFVGYKGLHTNYVFKNSMFTDNKYYLGVNGDALEPDTLNAPVENKVLKNGKVMLEEISADSVPRNYLNPATGSSGRSLHAGIFKENK